MPRLNGGIIGPVNNPSTSSAKGVWPLTAAYLAQRAGNWPPTLFPDPYFENTTLLLPGNGTNGAQNNTFLDSSTNAFTITRNGNTTQGTFSPFSQTGWGNYFDGSGDYLTTPTNAAFTYGTGDFCIEGWFYFTGGVTGAYSYVFAQGANTGSSSLGLYIQSGVYKVWNGSAVITGTASFVQNTWVHLAVTRSGTTLRLFVNGTQDGSATNSSNITTGTTTGISICRWSEISDTNYIMGYVSSFRVVNGSAVYTANFTPPTSPLTAITNTSLLTCQSNRFIDNSSNNFAITANGDVSVQAFSPFNPTASWSAETYGGSGYFDGSGDYLSGIGTTSSFNFMHNSTALFTFECWLYTSSTSNQILIDNCGTVSGNIGVYIGVESSQLALFIARGVSGAGNVVIYVTDGGTVPINQWVHIAVTYDQSQASSNAKFYINGVNTKTANKTANAPSSSNATNAMTVAAITGGTAPVIGYLSSLRISNSIVYSSAFTPPTSPVTGGSLLLNYTNAGIYDATSKNDLETVGNAQISTTQSKFGGSSMYFDGTGDSLDIVRSSNFVSNWDADFTIECWVYANNLSAQHIIFSNVGTNSSGYNSAYINTNGSIGIGKAGVNEITSAASTFTSGQWNHLAFVRYGSNLNIYYNGVSVASTASASTYLNSTIVGMTIGKNYQTTPAYMNGYIDDFRITKGIARYTSSFTPPTTAFPTF